MIIISLLRQTSYIEEKMPGLQGCRVQSGKVNEEHRDTDESIRLPEREIVDVSWDL